MSNKIVHILTGFGAGGNETFCLELLRHFPSNVEHALIVLDPSKRDMETEFKKLNWPIFYFPYLPQNRLKLLFWLVVKLKQLKPTALLCYSFGVTHLIASLASRLVGLHVIAVHAGNPPPTSRHSQKKWRRIVRLSRLLGVPIQACSNAVEYELRALNIELPRNSGTIPVGCDVLGIAARANKARMMRTAKNPFVIGMVARLDAIKDQATLIRAFSDLNHQFSALELWLVGDGERRIELEALVNQLDLIEKVRFWGTRTDVPELLGQMDVYVFSTTRNEGLGIALIEAMAAGLPVIASDVPACREVLDNGKVGILVTANEAMPLAEVLKKLIISKEERIVLGRQAHEHVLVHYNAEECVARWYNLLLQEPNNV